jgi:hypothetical protein
MIQEAYLEGAAASSKAQQALDTLEGALQRVEASSGMADAKAVQALDALTSIAHSLELLTGRSDIAHNATETDYLDLIPGSPAGEKVGRLKWGTSGTLEVSMGGGNIIQQVGEEIFVYGKASATITEGQLIMVTGSVGASGVLTFAPTATGLTNPNAILGVATENLANNAFGRVTIIGIVHGINTTGSSVGEVWADGDVLWYNPSFVGGMTKVKPSAPSMKTQVAIVINAGGGSSGSLQVEVLHGSTLGGTDSNVQLGALADKQLLQYDSVAGYWKNVAASGVAEPPITAGTAAQYWRGDKTWQDLFTQVRAATLAGLSTTTNAVITAADTVLGAFGKLQKQISDNLTTLTSHTGNTSNPHSTTAVQVGLGSVTNNAQLKIASNLSDLTNAATARTNLGIPTINSTTGPVSAPHATATTIATMSGATNGVYVICCDVNSGSPANYSAVSLITSDAGVLRQTDLQTAVRTIISFTGLTLQVTQTSGATQTVYYTIIQLS